MKEMINKIKSVMIGHAVGDALGVPVEFYSREELEEIFSEHKDKIAFMQHERIVHFLVTMMFAVILTIFMAAVLFLENLMLIVLVTIIMILLGFYIKHYYFLENTVQEMYRVYDRILEERRKTAKEEEA